MQVFATRWAGRLIRLFDLIVVGSIAVIGAQRRVVPLTAWALSAAAQRAEFSDKFNQNSKLRSVTLSER